MVSRAQLNDSTPAPEFGHLYLLKAKSPKITATSRFSQPEIQVDSQSLLCRALNLTPRIQLIDPLQI